MCLMGEFSAIAGNPRLLGGVMGRGGRNGGGGETEGWRVEEDYILLFLSI
jgi:hypothetical protein